MWLASLALGARSARRGVSAALRAARLGLALGLFFRRIPKSAGVFARSAFALYNLVMAKTSVVVIPEGYEEKFAGALTSGDRFTFSTVRRKVLFSSRSKIKGLTIKSLLPQISELWDGFTEVEKGAWNTAAEQMGKTGWRLFVQDQSLRIKNAIAGVATPSTLHQSWVGKMQVDNPADSIVIAQYHPYLYWISKKVRGKDQREPVRVTEYVSSPFTIGISYKSDLTAVSGGSPSARFYAVVYSLYQGRTIENIVEVPFDLSHDWVRVEESLGPYIGALKGYILYLELLDVTGSLLFDNVKAYHTGQNWARDPFCNNIDSTFTRVYFQVPRHWAAVDLENGAYYNSIYES